MKDFFTQCMIDLYALTGIEQVRWMQNDQVNGKRNFELCIAGMVNKSKEFTYIPEADQQRIILEMMTKDTDYEALNSRTVHKWLSMFKDKYFIDAQAPEETPRVQHTPEESAKIDKLAQDYLAQLAGGMGQKPKYNQLAEEMQKLKVDDKDRTEGKMGLAQGYMKNLKRFVCDGVEIPAHDEEGARKTFKLNFGVDPEKVEQASLKEQP